MSHRRKAELGADALTILLEEPTFELGPVVRNDTTWDPESADDRLKESDSSALGDADYRGGFRPLGELVNGDKEVPVAELPELFQLKCPSPALEARPHLNGNNPSIPRI